LSCFIIFFFLEQQAILSLFLSLLIAQAWLLKHRVNGMTEEKVDLWCWREGKHRCVARAIFYIQEAKDYYFLCFCYCYVYLFLCVCLLKDYVSKIWKTLQRNSEAGPTEFFLADPHYGELQVPWESCLLHLAGCGSRSAVLNLKRPWPRWGLVDLFLQKRMNWGGIFSFPSQFMWDSTLYSMKEYIFGK
jgi:hypothetical protein